MIAGAVTIATIEESVSIFLLLRWYFLYYFSRCSSGIAFLLYELLKFDEHRILMIGDHGFTSPSCVRT